VPREGLDEPHAPLPLVEERPPVEEREEEYDEPEE
jgi:hypothetical protein